jgi:glycosyltransferase involved in cell wall biosynthesis
VERRGLAAQKHVISITPYVRQLIEPLTKAKIYDIDNPVDERFYKIEHKPESGRILCVGWINERKNTLGAVEAFANIASRFPQSKLVIAGQAREQDYLIRIKQSIEQHGIGNRVDFLGHIDHLRLADELARADIFLLPSRQENSPMAIAEAMAAGVPVIASNRCGMPYMVEEGQNGYLVEPESTEQIEDRLARLAGSPQLCQKMSQAGQKAAIERFHPHAVAQKTREVYKRICADSK